ncbi:hypothetical protein D4Q76_00470 [archaeon]|nr:MAG: hypothetical protein D4Q76_00470 [archaeon]
MRGKKTVRCSDGIYREFETVEIEGENGRTSEEIIGKWQRVGSDGFIRDVDCISDYEIVGGEINIKKIIEVPFNIEKIKLHKDGTYTKYLNE